MIRIVFARIFLTGALISAVAVGLRADPVVTSTLGWIIDGTVSEATRAGDVVFLGGSIRTAAPTSKRVFGAVAMHTGSAEALFPALAFDDDVHVVIPDGVGGWFVGGEFSNIGDVDRDRLVRLTASGTIDLTWNARVGQGISSSVNALALVGGVLYVGGNFPNVNLDPRQNLAAISVATATLLTTWNPGANGVVTSLAIEGDTVYVGGSFGTLGNEPRANLGGVAASTALTTPWDPHPSGEVKDLLIDGGTLYVAGAFTTIDGAPRQHVAGFALPATSVLPQPSVTIDDDVYALAKSGATLYLAGAFHTVGGSSRGGVAAINAGTGALLPWNPDANDCVYDVAFSGGLIYLAGAFDRIGADVERLHAAAVDATSGAVAGWNPAFNGVAKHLFIDGATVHVAGDFSAYGAVVRTNALAIDLSTSELLSWNPAPNGWVTGMETAGEIVYIAGAFSEVGDVSRKGVAAVDAFTGDVVSTFNAQLNGGVNGLLLVGDTLYLAGDFSSAKSTARHHFAAVHAQTSELLPWNPDADDTGEALAADLAAPTAIYLAGRFTHVGGQTRNRLAAVDPVTGAPVTGWDPSANDWVYKLDVLNGIVYAGGKFTSIDGFARNHAAAIDATSGAPTAWNPSASGDLYDIDAFDDRVYLAGAFSSVAGESRSGMAIVSTSGTLLPWSQDDVNGSAVSVIDAASDGVLFGGIITSSADGKDVGAVFYPEAITTSTPNAPVQPKVVLVGNQARLSWSRAAHGAAPSRFILEGGSGRGRSDLANLNAGNVTELLTGPLPVGTYWFRLRSGNNAGVSAPSGDQAFVVGATGCSAPPGPPTDVTITRAGNSVAFTWRPPSGSEMLGYVLEAGSGKGRNDLVNADLGNVAAFQATAPDGGYWVRFRAYNACGMGLPSADTLVIMGTGGVLVGPPLELSAGVSGATVTLAWQAPAYGQGPFSYRLEAGSAPGLANAAVATFASPSAAVFGGVPPGVYYVRVRAINALGLGPASNEVMVVVR